jgi:hypothetical protein
MTAAGFPHSGTSGSTPTCGSPKLFAAYHALLRLSVPRHPPCALLSLDRIRSLAARVRRRGYPGPPNLQQHTYWCSLLTSYPTHHPCCQLPTRISGVRYGRSTCEDFPPPRGPTRRSRKEVIQPQVPLRLPCYDFAPVIELAFDRSVPCGFGHGLRALPTSMA